MVKRIVVLFFSALLLTGCGGGGGGGDLFFDDPFFGGDGGDLIAIDDQYSTFQNQRLQVGDSNGVLANDFICCEFDIIFPTQTASGGTITGADDGSFVYNPPANFTGTDFFVYRLEDDFGSSEGEVQISVNQAPAVGFVVDSLGGNDTTGSGVTGSPFATIQAALTAAGANGTVIVRPGAGTYPGTITLLDGQTLVGEDFQVVTAQGAVRPVLAGPVLMGDDCTLRGVTVDGNPVDGVGRVSGEVSQCDLINVPAYALELDNATGSWLVQDNLIENNGGGVAASLANSEQLQLEISFNTIQDNAFSGALLITDDSSELTAGLFNNLFARNQAGFTVDAEASNTSRLCLDLENNTNDDTYRLTRNGALFQVEQFSTIGTLNTGTFDVVADSVLEVSNGFCGF